jgi:hypothetical protein
MRQFFVLNLTAAAKIFDVRSRFKFDPEFWSQGVNKSPYLFHIRQNSWGIVLLHLSHLCRIDFWDGFGVNGDIEKQYKFQVKLEQLLYFRCFLFFLNCTGHTISNRKMVFNDKLRRKTAVSYSKVLSQRLRWPEESNGNFSQDSLFPGLESNSVFLWYETEMLTTKSLRSVQNFL